MANYHQVLKHHDEDLSDFQVLAWDDDGEDRVLAAVLFRFGHDGDFKTYYEYVNSLSPAQKEDLVNELMSERGKYDQPIRELEYAQMTFEALMDQGAYFEFKRHRMMTQTVQPLSTNLGFAVPKGIFEAGCEDEYLEAMRRTATLYKQIKSWNPIVASYIVPNGFNRRVLFTMNLREIFHFCRVRGAENAHFSIQRMAQRLAEAVKIAYPLLTRFLDLPQGLTWQSIEEDHFSTMRID